MTSISRFSASLTCAASLLLSLGCSDHDKRPDELGTSPGGADSGPRDPASLRVEFEELTLTGEPAFVTDFAFYPDSDTDFLALDKSGRLMRYRLGEQSAELISTAQVDGVYDKLDCGAISLAFEPDFAEGNYVYVGTCSSLTHSAVLRLDLDEQLDVVPGTEVEILSVGASAATRPWHNIGSIGFEPNGVMWAVFGDKVQGDPAQDQREGLGKLLRILPSREPGMGGFEPAPDGPLVGEADAEQAIYALGLRSPFRGTLDSRGFYWIGDVGSDLFEEVNVVRAPLQNFGWPELEGPCDDCGETTAPAFFWGRGAAPDYIADDPEVETTVARVAFAGPEVIAHEPDRYDGLLAGSVLFGDYCAGFLRHGRVDDDGVPTLDAPLGHLNNAGAFRQHRDGYVYAMTFGVCQTDVKNQADEGLSRLYRMVAKE
jgi:glucose/arabinose dehydrogenase